MIDLYTNGAAHQTAGMQHLLAGLVALGHDAQVLDIRQCNGHNDIAVIWGTRYLRALGGYRHKVIMEAGYFRDRLKYYSLGIGGLNGRADFNNTNSPSDRWVKHGVPRQPWRDGSGDYILVIGQVPGDMATAGIDLAQWYDRIIDQITAMTDMPVCFRPHPKAPLSRPSPGKALIQDPVPLNDALERASHVVTYNSTTGVDAAIAGVPVYTEDRGSMAWPIAAHTLYDLFNFKLPDRCQWLYNLAYTQWTAAELADGTAWGHLCRK